jgi:hypothetical protein
MVPTEYETEFVPDVKAVAKRINTALAGNRTKVVQSIASYFTD